MITRGGSPRTRTPACPAANRCSPEQTLPTRNNDTQSRPPFPEMKIDRVPGALADIDTAVEAIGADFWPVNQHIHDNPELAWHEFIAHDALTAFMETQPGWKVRRSCYGLKTAWIAVYDSGVPGPVVSFNAEYGIGHACGHNLIATSSVVGASAAAQIVTARKLPGRIVLYGTPAEENGGGKVKLLEAGAYKDYNVDLSLISHPSIESTSARLGTTAISTFKVEYFGVAAHAAANPWLGINALDALVQGYNNFSMLRQQTVPGEIIQGYITHGGDATNIIHKYAAGEFTVRADSASRLETLRAQVVRCFEAGALATGARLQLTHLGAYKDNLSNGPMADAFTRYYNALGGSKDDTIATDPDKDAANGKTQASTDQGDVSYAMPSISPIYQIEGSQGPHTPGFAKSAGTRAAYARALRVAKGLAGVAVEALRDQHFLADIKSTWEQDRKKSGEAVAYNW
ncbi:Peptidase M20 domain-containing protein 2 [Beauveria bassiana]|uniref:Peptidase M20 domain-containing protein 2 n=1 Tax=Beauveria bassiana TaxID=176275 RepID=A0A2N6NZK2_BEABA|nr:Peptidase M20 domain-containing protein 2 [Beauveria bassiana]